MPYGQAQIYVGIAERIVSILSAEMEDSWIRLLPNSPGFIYKYINFIILGLHSCYLEVTLSCLEVKASIPVINTKLEFPYLRAKFKSILALIKLVLIIFNNILHMDSPYRAMSVSLFFVTLQPKSVPGHIDVEVSRSQAIRHTHKHTRARKCGR